MAWSPMSVGLLERYILATESVTLPDPGAASESTIESSNLTVDVSGKKFVVKLEVTAVNEDVTAADGALNIRVQCSPNNSDWFVADTMALNVDNTGLNSDFGDADLTAWHAPYWRFQVFSDGTDISAAPDLLITYAAK